MKKNRAYFTRIAMMKTAISVLFYLLVPLFAQWYIPKLGNYWGYAVFASVICILINVILLVQAWTLVFDDSIRKEYLKED